MPEPRRRQSRAAEPSRPDPDVRPSTMITKYYDFQWAEVASRKEAAFAIHTLVDDRGNVEKRFETFKEVPTRATDPKTGSHSR